MNIDCIRESKGLSEHGDVQQSWREYNGTSGEINNNTRYVNLTETEGFASNGIFFVEDACCDIVELASSDLWKTYRFYYILLRSAIQHHL